MSLFKHYPENDKCPKCFRDRNKIMEGLSMCPYTCHEDSERDVALRSTWGHIWDAAKCFFNFNFKASLGAILFAVERYNNTGDYHPETGRFYVKGYLKK